METVEAAPSQGVVALERFTDLVEAIVAADREIASAHARRAQLIDQARRWSEASVAGRDAGVRGWSAAVVARRELSSELAAALRIPERTAESLVGESQLLGGALSATGDALTGGQISYRHAQAMIDHATSLPAEAIGDFEQAALPFAAKLTVAKFNARARVLREHTHPETITTRHAASLSDRTVEFAPARDGMAHLTAYLSAVDAQAIYNRVTDIARSHQIKDETRTLTQLRADTFSDALLDSGTSAGTGTGIRARVLVTVPVLTLLGISEEPGSLEGYGPIDADTARRLAAHAPSFTRLLTHPESGAVLSVGRARYAVPEDLKLWLRVRDETCRAVGCNRGARHCDLDHTDDWQHGGETTYDNLAHLCPTHHNLKHHTAWQAQQRDDGVIEWTSPAGKQYFTDPATKLRGGP